MDYFKKLEHRGLYFNDKQKEAIAHTQGPLLVVAGPGSGKTRVITGRTLYLIQKAEVSPSNILVITFTRAAANEMKTRFRDYPGVTEKQYNEIDFGTFHSTFYKIINSYYGRHLRVLDQLKAFSIIKSILKSLHQPSDDEVVQCIQNGFSLISNQAVPIERFVPEYLSLSLFMQVFEKYTEYKRNAKCIDFDDMLIMCKGILESDDSMLSRCRQKYKYILIDEFQDINKIQLDIVRLLSNPAFNVFAVGDDDQAIYGFRGSTPQFIVNFKDHFGSCKTVVLDTNYRSTDEIIDMSVNLISNNTSRIEKQLKSGRGSGVNPEIIYPGSEEEEAVFIMDSISELIKNGLSYKDFAVLYRTNIQSRAIVDELIKKDTPFNIKDGLSSFFDHWICRDITSYLKLSLDNNDISSLIQIINRPSRFISRELLHNIFSSFTPGSMDAFSLIDQSSSLNEPQKLSLKNLQNNIRAVKQMLPGAAVNFIRNTIGYDNYIRNYCFESNIQFEELFEILNEYNAAASGFNTIQEFIYHIQKISTTLKNRKDNLHKSRDSITLTTIHGAKGLEFPCVFIAGAVEGYLPHKKSLVTGESIEEERRLFYVAVTRCKDRLYIMAPKKHHGKSINISRFLLEAQNLTKDSYTIDSCKKLTAGRLVNHRVFGTGRVVSCNGRLVEIEFNSRLGIKKLDLQTIINDKIIDF